MTEKYDHQAKSEMRLAYEDARDLSRAEVRRLTRRIQDRIYVEIDREFRRALLAGENITVRPNMEKIIAAAWPEIKRELGRGRA